MPVLVNEQRKKLSKRRDKVALEQYRDEGYLADAMVNYLMTLGWAPPATPRSCRGRGSRPSSGSRTSTTSPAFFDLKKLAAFNGEYIRMLPLDEFIERVRAVAAAGVGPRACSPGWPRTSRHRVVTLADVAPMVDFLFLPDPVIDEGAWNKTMASEFAAPLLARRGRRVRLGRVRRCRELKSTLEAIAETLRA